MRKVCEEYFSDLLLYKAPYGYTISDFWIEELEEETIDDDCCKSYINKIWSKDGIFKFVTSELGVTIEIDLDRVSENVANSIKKIIEEEKTKFNDIEIEYEDDINMLYVSIGVEIVDSVVSNDECHCELCYDEDVITKINDLLDKLYSVVGYV